MSAPYEIKLEPASAQELVSRGATIVLLDVPQATAIGIDHQTFLAGPLFRGIKMLPPGIHLISYSSSNSQGAFGPTTAFFINVRSSQVVAYKWNPTEEFLVQIDENDDQLAQITTAVKDMRLDQHLAPYDLTSYHTWQMLSNRISDQVLAKIAPVGGNINVLADVALNTTRKTAAEIALDEQLQRGRHTIPSIKRDKGIESSTDVLMNNTENTADPSITTNNNNNNNNNTPSLPEEASRAAPHAGQCFFTPLPRLIKRPGLSPAELTALNLDKTKILKELLSAHYNENQQNFIGEFQFSYLSFLLGHSLDGFLQWKSFLTLLFNCEDAVMLPEAPYTQLFVDFLNAFHAQLFYTVLSVNEGGEEQKILPSSTTTTTTAPFGAALIDELITDSFLKQLSTRWLRWAIDECNEVPQNVVSAAERVSAVMKHVLGWECRRRIVELKEGTRLDRQHYYYSGSGSGRERRKGGDIDFYGEDDSDEEEEEDGPVIVSDISPEYM